MAPWQGRKEDTRPSHSNKHHKIKESPPDLEEVIATIKDPESVVEIVPMPSTQGGEVQGGVDVELNSKNTNPTDSDD